VNTTLPPSHQEYSTQTLLIILCQTHLHLCMNYRVGTNVSTIMYEEVHIIVWNSATQRGPVLIVVDHLQGG